METKSLLFGLIGFFLGGLIVSIAANTSESPANTTSDMTMSQMTADLKGKTGDEYDTAFIAGMIEHHEGAVEMAKLSADNAKHDEIKKMSLNIISAQESEIAQMRQWQADWGYATSESTHTDHGSH